MKGYDFSLDIPIAKGSLEEALETELAASTQISWPRMLLAISFFGGIGAAILLAVCT